MSDPNTAILQRANAAIVTGDYEGFLSHCTEDTEWTFVGDRTLKGKAAVREYMKTAYVVPPKFDVDRLVAEDDVVVALGTITTRDDNGTEIESAYCDVWRLRDGRLAGLKAFVIEAKRTG